MTPSELPIDAVLDTIRGWARGGVLRAEPGAGKTTRVPPALLSADGEVWVLEPRRVAARAAAQRMAEERGERVGQTVGYHVRYDHRAGPTTRIRVMTEGVLLRRLQDDPLLEGVSAVVFDEFHERRLDSDLALALTAHIRDEVRDDLRVVVMSATLEPEPIAAWLGVPTLRCPGRTFPVDIEYLPRPDPRPIDAVAADGVRRALAAHDGDVLVFLPGVRTIRDTAERLADLDVDRVPLYGDLGPDAQDDALRPGPRRRVVLATNVAETSVTVPGVRVVVDTGWARAARHDPATGLDRLDLTRVSRASADQRAGRAGRTGPGRCLRLWTEREQQALADHDPPEVARLDLTGAALQLRVWGRPPDAIRWFEAPPAGAWQRAAALLDALGATVDGRVSPLGRRMAELPVHPRLARLALAAEAYGWAEEGAWAAALLSERDPLRGADAQRPSPSDLLDRLDALRAGRGEPAARAAVERGAAALLRNLHRRPATLGRDEAMGRAALAAWPDRVVRRRTGDPERGRMVGGKGVHIRGSAVHDELFVAIDVEDGAEARVRCASAVDPSWLPTTAEVVTELVDDRVRGRRVVRYGDLELGSHPAPVDPEHTAAALVALARAALDRAVPDTDGWRQLLGRWRAASRWDASIPAPDAATLGELLPSVCAGARGLDDLRRADWAGAARAAIGWRVWQRIDQLAPAQIVLPSGRSATIDWTGERPTVAARIQDFFGSRSTPTVGPGVRLLLHLLAPNQRVQQITDDLGGFWTTSYPSIRKELRGRYPKHRWPEDPTAAP